MNRFLTNYPIRLWLFLALAGFFAARAEGQFGGHEDPLETQDRALAWALENHPDIIAAKARIAIANAELYGKRIEVSRQVLGSYGHLKKLDAQIDALKSAINRSKTEFGKPGGASKDKLAVEIQDAEARLVQGIGQRAQAEKELRLQIGTASPAADANSPNKKTAVARQTPQGPIVEKMKTVLEKPTKLDFTEIPLADTIAYLTDTTGVMFSIQKQALEAAGIGTDQPTTLRTSEVPLHAALQAFQDSYPDLQFVLRDYGILVTTKDYSEDHGYAPVLEMGKESAATFKSR